MRFLSLFLLAFCLLAFPADGNAEPVQNKESSVVELHTSKGIIVIELNEEKAPATVANFKKYVEEGFYEGTIFHRVIAAFMIQGGGLTENMASKKNNAAIQNEADNGLANDKYTISMARTNDPHSATSQFFINTNNNASLNYKAGPPVSWGYCVFGKVIEGTDVVDAIEKTTTQSLGYYQDVPVEPIVIEKAVFRQ